jgi:hypothetical protein
LRSVAVFRVCGQSNFLPNESKCWPDLSWGKTMFPLSVSAMVGELVFGSIGLVAFIYGKRQSVWTPMFLGLALMIYPYFVADPIVLFSIGIGLTASLYFRRL